MSHLSSCLSLTFSDAVVLQPHSEVKRPDYTTAQALVRRVPRSSDWMFASLLRSGDNLYTSSIFVGDIESVSRVAEYQMGSAFHECDVVTVCYSEEGFPSNLHLY